MNIEQYRALKAQESAQPQQPVEQVVAPVTVPVVETVVTKPEEPKPITVEIDGKEVTIDELKNGYLRQSDYTKKTQDLSRERSETKEAIEFYDYLKANPTVVQQIQTNGGQVPDRIDPTLSKVKELEDKMYDMMLQNEIEGLTSKYPDFEIKDVLEIAKNKGITNLEDAYILSKSSKITNNSLDVDKLKEDLRKEILKDLESERNSTQTIISTNSQGSVVDTNLPTLSPTEVKVAKMMKLSDADYVKWRDMGIKKK